MRPRVSIVAIIITFLILTLSGCGKLAPGQNDASQKGTLKIIFEIPGQEEGMTTQSFEVSQVEIRLTNTDTNEEVTGTYAIDKSGTTVEIDEINPGPWTITAVVWGGGQDAGYRIYSGTANCVVKASLTTMVTLHMTYVSGGLKVYAYKPPSASSGTLKLVSSDETVIAQGDLTPPSGDDTYYTVSFSGLTPSVRYFYIFWTDADGKEVNKVESAVYIKPDRIVEMTVAKDNTVGGLEVRPVWDAISTPDPPTGVSAEYTIQNLVQLNWTASPSEDVVSYRIFRATSPTGLKRFIGDTGSTDFSDDSADKGRTYWYWVVAETADGTTSDYSEPVEVKCQLLKISYLLYGDIEMMEEDGSGWVNLTWGLRGKYDLYEDIYSFSWSPDGERIAIAIDGDIYVVNADGSGLYAITNDGWDPYEYDPVWSPDGNEIAYVSGSEGWSSDRIYRVNAAEPSNKQLISEVNDAGVLSWSVNNVIAYTSMDNEFDQIFTVDAYNPGSPSQLTSGSDNEHPNWSPDGTKIAYTSWHDSGDYAEICVMEAGGTLLACLTNNAKRDIHPSWSPDGSKIAFERRGEEIYVWDIYGSGEVRCLSMTEYAEKPVWVPVID
jgi:hypothetical protein